MNERVVVTAVRDFHYNGQTITAGDRLWMPDIDAALHIDQGNVSGNPQPGEPDPPDHEHPDALPDVDSKGEVPPEPAPDPPLAATIPKRRRYRRKDLTADKS